MVTIKEFSKIIIGFFNSKGDYISNLKLQKLLYYIQAWYFVHLDGKNIFTEDMLPQAWVHGPVYPLIYDEYKQFRSKPIVVEGIEDISTKESMVKIGLDEDSIELIQEVIKQYGMKTGFELEYLSHSETPWITARGNTKPHMPSTETISKESIIKYYSSLLD